MQEVQGVGVYSLGCLINHDCQPNVEVEFGATSLLRALRPAHPYSIASFITY